MPNSPYIIDTTDEKFAEEVILKSDDIPVLIDFWAPWCGPCQMLAPVLEEVASHFEGKIRIAKVNTDENPALAQHFQIRGIPALKLIKEREIVFETGGVQAIAALIEAITPFTNVDDEVPSHPSDQETNQINSQELSPAEALEQLRLVLGDNQDDVTFQSQYIQAMVANDELDAASAHFDSLSNEMKETEQGQQIDVFLEFAQARAQAPALSELEDLLAENPNNLSAHYQLGVNKLLDGQTEAALQEFLFIVKSDNSYDEGLGRKALVAAFALIDDTELIKTYRKRMANYLY